MLRLSSVMIMLSHESRQGWWCESPATVRRVSHECVIVMMSRSCGSHWGAHGSGMETAGKHSVDRAPGDLYLESKCVL